MTPFAPDAGRRSRQEGQEGQTWVVMSGLASVILSARHIKHATLYRHTATPGVPVSPKSAAYGVPVSPKSKATYLNRHLPMTAPMPHRCGCPDGWEQGPGRHRGLTAGQVVA
jgi:hypothetical protein